MRRDGVFEFAGAIESRLLDDPALKKRSRSNLWTLSGRDLLGFFGAMRVVGGDNADARGPDPAETLIKEYWTAHLLDPGDADRDITNDLSVTFTVPASTGLGGSVIDDGRRKNLLTGITIPKSREGQLLCSIALVEGTTNPTGYRLDVAEPVDRTIATGVLPFSVGWETVRSLAYRENLIDLVNFLYVLGAGTADARTVRTRSDTASIDAYFRHEGFMDARNAVSDAQLDAEGDAEIARILAAAITADAQPRTDARSPIVYRTDWDVGDVITIAVPEVGIEVDRMIASATVALSAKRTEDVSLTLGDRAPSMAKLVAEAVRRTLPSQVQ